MVYFRLGGTNMNKYISNFYDLYSLDDSKVYKAILEKKDWLFKKLYFKGSFVSTLDSNGKVIYPYLFSLMDQCLPFSSFEMKKELFIEHENMKEIIKNRFDENYACSYLYDSKDIPLKKGEFLVELDFNLINDKMYKELVANFYPCINTVEELDLFYNPDRIEDLLKYPMYGEKGKWVLIIAKQSLINERYYLPIYKKIYYKNENLDNSQIDALEIIAEKVGITVEEY